MLRTASAYSIKPQKYKVHAVKQDPQTEKNVGNRKKGPIQ